MAATRNTARWDPRVQYEPLLNTVNDAIFLHDLSGRLLEVNAAACDRLGYSRQELLSRRIGDFDAPEQAAGAPGRLEEVFRRGSMIYETVQVARDGRQVPTEVSSRIIEYGDQPAVLSVARDITERKSVRDALQRRVEELAALNRLGRRVGESLQVEEVARTALRELAEVVRADVAMLFLAQGDELRRIGLHPEHNGLRAEMPATERLGQCLCGLAARAGRCVYSADIHQDDRCTLPECKSAGMRSLAALPLKQGDEVLGVLALASVAPRDFAASAAFLETLAGQVSAGLGNALLHRRLERHAAELQRHVEQLQQAQAALREQNAFRSAVIERVAEGLGVCHGIDEPPYVRFTVWNDRMTEITGYAMDQINERGWYQTMYPDPRTQKRAAARMARMRDGDDLRGEEWQITRADGQPRVLSISTSALRTDKGTVHVLALMEDVTDRRQAEAALRLTQFSVDCAADAAFWIGPDGRLVYVNEAACGCLGYAREDLLGMGLWDIDPTLPRGQWRERWRRLKRQGTAVEESLHRRKDGTTFPVEVTGNYVAFEGREYNFAFARDISGRKRAEQEMLTSQRRYRELYESSRDGYAAVDLDGRVFASNSAFRELVGYTEEELASKTYYDLTPAKWHIPETEILQEQVFPRGYSDVYEKEYIRKDGRVVPIEIRTYLLRGPTGEPEGMWAFVRDISERKELEDQLRQAQKMEAVGRLAGGIAHDFNNQLTVVKGYCDLMLSQAEAGAAGEEIREIRAAAERAERLTRQLLAFSRKQVLNPKVTDLNEVLREVENPLSRMIGEDIRLSIVTDPQLGNVLVDRSQVQQALMNLVVNARDAMPAGGRLTLETANVDLDSSYAQHHRDAKAGPHVMLAVSDTGKGMDSATTERIFEPFFTTKEPGAGTGLGLSMVYGFVRQSGGSIYVYSEPGAGTTFKVYLPWVDARQEAPEGEAAHEEVPGGTETVLVVEDDASVRELIVRALRRGGYTVLEAGGAEEALTLAGGLERPIHLLVTDVVMPSMNGPELAEGLRSTRPELAVLYVSGYAENAIVHHGILAEGVELLPKPFHPRDLAQRVRGILDAAAPPGADP